MKAMIVLAVTVGSATAAATEPSIVDACLRVAEHELAASLIPENVQAFPELTPPRVRMEVVGESGKQNDLIAALLAKRGEPTSGNKRSYGFVMCEFASSSPPFNLTKFDCAGISCFITKERLEELQTLMKREGF